MRLGDRPVQGDADFTVTGVASLEDGGPDALGFVRSARHASALARSKIGAVIAPPEVEVGGRPAIRSPSPKMAPPPALRRITPTGWCQEECLEVSYAQCAGYDERWRLVDCNEPIYQQCYEWCLENVED